MRSKEDLRELQLSETRIILLYSTRQEGNDIMRWAGESGLTGNSFVWIATQSVIGEIKEALPELPAGMLGKCSEQVFPKNFLENQVERSLQHFTQRLANERSLKIF